MWKRKITWIGCGIIVLWTIFPILSVLISSGVASAFDCQLDEGGVHPCMAFGTDIGEELNMMFVMGWFFFLTIPSGVVALVIFLIVMAIVSRKRASAQAE